MRYTSRVLVLKFDGGQVLAYTLYIVQSPAIEDGLNINYWHAIDDERIRNLDIYLKKKIK